MAKKVKTTVTTNVLKELDGSQEEDQRSKSPQNRIYLINPI